MQWSYLSSKNTEHTLFPASQMWVLFIINYLSLVLRLVSRQNKQYATLGNRLIDNQVNYLQPLLITLSATEYIDALYPYFSLPNTVLKEIGTHCYRAVKSTEGGHHGGQMTGLYINGRHDVKPRHVDRPLVAGCSAKIKGRIKHIFRVVNQEEVGLCHG